MKNNKMNLSYSKVTTLLSCPRRFYYQYIIHLEEEPMPINYGDLGSRAHLILEEFYKYVDMESENIEKEFNRKLVLLYRKHFKGINDPSAGFAKGIRNFCEREVKRYNSLENKDLFMPRYSEVALTADIENQHFRGRLDAVYTNPDGSLKPVDYKFTNSNKISTQQQFQSYLYIVMLEQSLNVYCEDYTFWFMKNGLGPTKKGFEKIVSVTDELRTEMTDIIIDSVEIIEKEEYNIPDSFGSYFCTHFCPYYSACLEDKMGWIIES